MFSNVSLEIEFIITIEAGYIITANGFSLPEEDATFIFRFDNKPPNVDIDKNFASGTFDLVLTFSEKVTNSSDNVLDTGDFTLAGFNDENIMLSITNDNKTMATFTDLTFASSDTFFATITVKAGYQDEAGNSGVSKPFTIFNEEVQVIITALEHPSAITSNNTMIKFQSNQNITALDDEAITSNRGIIHSTVTSDDDNTIIIVDYSPPVDIEGTVIFTFPIGTVTSDNLQNQEEETFKTPNRYYQLLMSISI